MKDESNVVKVGPKGRHARIPEGWRRVEDDDVCKAGDKFACTTDGRFMRVNLSDIGFPASTFDCLIREEIG